ncbi:sulfite exporter TauE/SafE family protein [Verrucomicrobiaceae bacterium N1E253]|uniref:Sulfite exporter TauE/SafE family protein n=1 Tax=Oceaniferula marina TaxID=2748318 RepID=A0A851GR90_9BACT|nr:sulfite exporter TauE/SafE family protein [Oceaniferula marina]NWK56724.1 sulfite exporter TauE/SafE family protein [Oceaniferula marina]
MFENINSPAIALVTGAIVSVHCVGMCGPIACSLTALKKDESSRVGAATAYHGGRLISYTLIGAMLGAIGAKPLEYFHHSSFSLLSWVLVAAFVAFALGLEKKIPRPAFLKRWATRLRFKAMTISATRGGLAMGLATPLLPCAPLYLFFAICLATGSAIKGAEFALAFAFGTVPLLWASQLGMQRIQLKLGPKWVKLIQRSVALLAAFFIAQRLLYDPTPDLHKAPEDSPSGASPVPSIQSDEPHG